MSPSRYPRRRATLASLAAELKVSRTTVSNAYNRPDQLSAELRERVLEAARRLGYPGPDPVARSLRMNKAGAVGLLLTEELSYAFHDPSVIQFLEGLAEICDEAETGLLLIPAGRERSDTAAAQSVQQASVDGFVVYSVADDDPYLAAVRRRPLPIVVCDQPRSLERVSRVTIDDATAMTEIVNHILALGHRNIAVISMRLAGDRNDRIVSTERLASAAMHVQRDRIGAVIAAAEVNGIARENIAVVERFDHTVEAGASAAEEVLSHFPETTALICTSDVLAIGARGYVLASGRTVPGDISVTGFDGVPQALDLDLTTVIQPAREKGRRAGQLLFTPPEKGHYATEVLPTSLHLGSSTGPRVER